MLLRTAAGVALAPGMSRSAAGLGPPPRVRASDDVVALSRHPQLFLDDVLLSHRNGLRREVQRPTKHPSNPLIVQEHPWERRTIQVYGTVQYEPQRDRFRCWYLASHDPDGRPEYYMCYAESVDGVRWTKPMVGTAPMPSFPRHNIVVAGGHGLCVLHTPDDPDSERQYKGLGGRTLAFSPDGIHWTLDTFEAAGKNDTGSSVVRWNGEYLAYVRNQHPDPQWPGVMRAVALSTSRDFRTWTPKKTILLADEQDGYPWTQPYGLEVTAYGDQLIGLLPMLHLDRVNGNNSLGVIRVQLVVSRDGRRWHRVADRGAFLEPTPARDPPAWDGGTIFPSTTMLVKGDRVYIYYTGVERRHGEGRGARKGIGLATLPVDRFVALVPVDPGAEGVAETKPLSVSGKRLLVNADVSAGTLRVEVLDASGAVRPGFERDRCRIVARDALRHEVTWAASDAVRCIGDARGAGPFRLRILLRGGAFFALQVVD